MNSTAQFSGQLIPMRVGVFNGAWNLPIWIAQNQGFFAAGGLEVQVLPTKTSGGLMQDLYVGELEVALAGVDNFLAYEQGAGEAKVGKDDDLRIVMGGDGGFLKLVAQAPYRSIAQLRGKSIGVDALTTGFAFVVRELLRRSMVSEESVNWLAIGATETRHAALLDQKCDATLLRLPYCLMSEFAGTNILAAGDALGPYQGTVAAVRRRWAQEHSERLIAFLRGYARALDWCANPANRHASIEELQQRLALENETMAAKVLDTLFGAGGLQRDMRVNRDGLATVIELRERYTGQRLPANASYGMIDETFLRSAGVSLSA
jgi:ABC-type nitrate/sulfonate/bicarbonate transport system substrate-binding protein